MPESTCLHIQDRESGPIRVVELPWISVRIGRAAYCEVCLPDEQIDDETCRLTRRGRSWSIVPASGRGLIVFEGRRLEGPCPVPYDVPFRIGRYCLTLRNDVTAEPDWEMYPASAPYGLPAPPVAPGPSPVDPAEQWPVAPEPAGASTAAPPGGAGRTGGDPDRWRARWKAAEAHFKARDARLVAGDHRGAYPSQSGVPLDHERPDSRAPAAVSSPAEPRPRPAHVAGAPRLEPSWTVPRPDPTVTTPRIGPALRPAPPLVAGHHESIKPATPRPPTRPPAYPVSSMVEAAPADPPRPLPDMSDPGGDVPGAEAAVASSEAAGGSVHDPESPHSTGYGLPEDQEARSALSGSNDPVPEVAGGFVNEPVPAASSHEEGPRARPSRIGLSGDPPEARIRPGEKGGARSARESSAGEVPGSPARPFERGPRKRKPPRERAAARRSESARRLRPDVQPAGASTGPRAGVAPIEEAELPSVREILANHRSSPGPRPAVERRRRGGQAVPTIPLEPGHWVVPGWLALPPVGAGVLGVGLLACALSSWWAADSSNAAIVTQRLLAADGSGRRRPLPKNVVPPGDRWVGTTAQHLAHWAIYLAGAGEDERMAATEAPPMLGRALEVSPLNATARLAMAQLEDPGREGPARIRGLGLSRDAVSLAWSARRLLDSGKKEAALRLYHRALSAASGGGLSRTATPRFAEDPALRRYYYFLPAEDAVRDIVAELAARDGLEFREWRGALPRNPTVLLATARLLRELREQGRAEADALLDQLLGDDWTGAEDGQADPRLLAARAEALVLRSRWQDAAEQYRRAIELVDNELIRRSWWFNLADIAQRLNDEPQRQAAIRAAMAVANSDDIARRAGLIQRSGAAKPRDRYGTARAD